MAKLWQNSLAHSTRIWQAPRPGVLHRKRKHVIGPWALLGIAWYRLIETSKLAFQSPKPHLPCTGWMADHDVAAWPNHSATVQATRPVLRCSNPLQSLGQLPTGLAARKWKCHMYPYVKCARMCWRQPWYYIDPHCTWLYKHQALQVHGGQCQH